MLPLVEARGRRSRLAVFGDFSGRLASIARGTLANFRALLAPAGMSRGLDRGPGIVEPGGSCAI